MRWIHVQFTDLLGTLRHFTASSRLLTPKVLEEGLGKLDASSVKGFGSIEESDMVLRPLPETFALVPWESGVARMIGAVYFRGSRLTRDPRYVAELLDSTIKEQGMELVAAAELEYFIFDKVVVTLEAWRQSVIVVSSEGFWSAAAPFNKLKDGYYVPYPKDRFESFKMEVAETLSRFFGIDVEVLHHEVAAASQHEINFRGGPATYVGDSVQTVKYVVKALAHRRGYIATFMPKPLYGDNGSGMHVHVSLWRDGRNVLYDPTDEYAGLSQLGRYFIGGLLEHGRALAAITNPTINSYRRLVPGYEAPVYLVWSRGNRSAAVRVPAYARSEASVRVEYRPPDPSANPYLAVAAIVLAGIDGIRKRIDPGDPVKENVYALPLGEGGAWKRLPRSLEEALDELECDNEWLRPVFSKDLLETYIELKRKEARALSAYPSPAEFYYYIDA